MMRQYTTFTLGRSSFVFAGLGMVSTVNSVVAPYVTTRLPPYMCFATSLVVSYAMVLIGVLFAVLGIIFDGDDRLAIRALSMNLAAAALPLGAFVIFLILRH
jgi:hypothetical protein